MIIELPNYVPLEYLDKIRESVLPFLDDPNHKSNKYPFFPSNRDGKTVNVSQEPALKTTDELLSDIFRSVQQNVIAKRYKPGDFQSGDSGYEYHLYNPGEFCHYHSDGEFSGDLSGPTLIRYAAVVLHMNTVEDGGETIFPSQNKTIKTEAGKVVIWPPYGMFGHYTTPSSVQREVIVTWFVYTGISAVRYGT
jgi:hypothetical protein